MKTMDDICKEFDTDETTILKLWSFYQDNQDEEFGKPVAFDPLHLASSLANLVVQKRYGEGTFHQLREPMYKALIPKLAEWEQKDLVERFDEISEDMVFCWPTAEPPFYRIKNSLAYNPMWREGYLGLD